MFSPTDYKSHSLQFGIKARHRILPCYPPRSTLYSYIEQQIKEEPMENINEDEEMDFLLCNIPKTLLSYEQYQRRQFNQYISLFDLQVSDHLNVKKHQSFLSCIYEHFYKKFSPQWHIDIPVLDHNLARLDQLASQNKIHFSLSELAMALEFYLQMDIDVFHLKTPFIPQEQDNYQGIFTNDEQEIKGYYDFFPCKRYDCLCCTHALSTTEFAPKRIHRFLSQYIAVLNYHATCIRGDIIYALTCPCNTKDYVAYTDLPFVNCLFNHRLAIARTIVEFLLGESNMNFISTNAVIPKIRTNGTNRLYQHAIRCRFLIQAFLDYNPLYWYFVPVRKGSLLPGTPSDYSTLTTLKTVVPAAQRSDSVALELARNVPKPTDENYTFTSEQIVQQMTFFKHGQDYLPINVRQTNFYKATIVAVLPKHCSNTLKKFIESLFITHTECQLNEEGHLINQENQVHFDFQNQWYHGLIRRS